MKAAQQQFIDALLGRAEPPAGLTGAARGFATYRGNAQALSAQALAVAFPKLAAELGEQDFAALAWSFWRAAPPASGDLGEWGSALDGFLLERAGAGSGLPGLARLEWALHVAERAPDARLDADSLGVMAQVPPDALWLVLRPGLSVITLEAEALARLGLAAPAAADVLVWREGWRGHWQCQSGADARFMRALLAHESLSQALECAEVKGSAPEADCDFDFSAWLQAGLQRAWLQGARITPPNRTPP